MKKFRLIPFLLAILFIPFNIHAQGFKAKSMTNKSEAPKASLMDYDVVELDVNALVAHVHASADRAAFDLEVGNYKWSLDIHPTKLLPEDYVLQVHTDKGIERYPKTKDKAFYGVEMNGGGQARLTLDDDFIYGYVETGGKQIFIEPLWYFEKNAAKDLFVVYTEDDVDYSLAGNCGVTEMHDLRDKYANDPVLQNNNPDNLACFRADVAIASDRSMFNKYGSVIAVENHNIAVLNNVQGDYTGAFIHDIEYRIPTQVVISGTDPWTSSTSANAFLDDFTQWGNQGNFGVSFDIGSLWTNRDFAGSTIGLAWVGTVCTSNKYHVLQDFSSNGQSLRVLVSHEIGHNWSIGHDTKPGECPPNFIMCPFVNTSANWSANSVMQFDNYMPGRIGGQCLEGCNGPGPMAAFSASANPACVGQTIQFTDLSTDNPTSWSWSFPNGTPSTSTDPNPIVTFNTPGQQTVVLSVNNANGPGTAAEQVIIQEEPTAVFGAIIDGANEFRVICANNSDADTYLWDFGDNSPKSTEQNGVYEYPFGGTYTITLEAMNSCGADTASQAINTAPSSLFDITTPTACVDQPVIYSNLSSTNATTYIWVFDGGNPNFSTEFVPNAVTYANPGIFDATLAVSNGVGADTLTITDIIEIVALPSVDFTFSANGFTVDFTDASTGVDTYLWDFGDGNTSTDANPTHTYAAGGSYTVTLTSSGECGTDTKTQVIDLASPPIASFNTTFSPTSRCATVFVSYANTSSFADSYNWSFPGGNPATATTQNVTVQYLTGGDYTAFLTVTNALGTDTVEEEVEIFQKPNASFNTSLVGSTATFTNTTVGGVTYAWDFGDGNTSTDENPVHTYAGPGTYIISMVATSPCGTDDYLWQVTVTNTAATAAFTSNTTNGCAGLSVEYNNTSANATTYQWTFPGGTPATSTNPNPTITYAAAGTYDVILVASNSASSATASETDYITIEPDPTADFSSAVNNTVATFSNASSNALTYSWDFGDGNSSTNSDPAHNYTNDGVYTVVLTATNACGSSTSTEQVTISTPVTAAFTANANSGCAGLAVEYMSMASPNTTNFDWVFPGGTPATSTDPNPTVVYNTAGTYNVTLVASNAGNSATATENNFISIEEAPTAAFVPSVTGFDVAFANASMNAVSYAWDFGDGNSSTMSDPSHTYASDGAYTVVLTTTNPCGTATESTTITVGSAPNAAFSAIATEGCGPFEVEFTNASSSNATSFAWTFENGTPAVSTDENPVVVFDTPGSYDVTLIATNASGENTSTQTDYITVLDGPSADFASNVSGLDASFTNTSMNALSYTWDFGDGNSSMVADPTHTYAGNGTYTVVLTSTNACGTSTATELVTINAAGPTAAFTSNTIEGCGPLTVEFTNNATNATGVAWTFEGGTPATSTDDNPTVTFNTAGTYDVTLVATNAAGTDTELSSDYITVLPEPTADFNTSTTGFDASFTSTSSNGTTYAWDFGDGNSSTLENPMHTYAMNGSYNVVLTVTNLCGEDIFEENININAAGPSASFDANTVEGCGPLTVEFSNNSANASSVLWTFEGGTPATSTDDNPTVTFNTAGNFDVTLIATNAAGTDTELSSDYITVLPEPTADFNTSTTGLDASFTSTSSNGTTYAWDFGDGNSSSLENPMHTYAMNGSYTVVLTVTNLCGEDIFEENININAAGPSASFDANTVEGCGPLTVEFSNNSANASSVLWTFEGGTPATSTDDNPTVVFNTAGNFDVTLVATNMAGSDTESFTDYISVYNNPTAAFSSTNSLLTTTFTNASTDAVSYAWDFGDGNTSTAINPTHTYSADGSYSVVLTVTNPCGSDMFTQSLTVSSAGSAPVAGFSVSQTAGCAPALILYSDNSTGNPTAWNWTFVGGTPATSTAQNPIVTYATAGTYSATLVATNSFGDNTITQTDIIQVFGDPQGAIFFDAQLADVDFQSNSTNGVTFAWDFGDGETSTAQNPSHTYASSGTYTVTLTISDGCADLVLTETIIINTVGTSDLDKHLGLRVFPNPNAGLATIQLDAGFPAGAIQAELINALGQVQSRQILNYSGQFFEQNMDYTALASGLYFLRLRLGDNVATVRVVIE